MKWFWSMFALAVCGLTPSVVFADPCTAELLRRAGAEFSGVVRYVGDGDSLCVGATEDPASWIEARLGNFDAPELHSPDGARSKRLLESVAMGHQTQCRAVRGRAGRVVVYDRVIGVCRIGTRPIGGLLRAAGAPSGGN